MVREPFAFVVREGETLASKALRACETILGSAVAVRSGEIDHRGGNNVMANAVVSAFSASEMNALLSSENPLLKAAYYVINAQKVRKETVKHAMPGSSQSHIDETLRHQCLEQAARFIEMVEAGWITQVKPRYDDVNAGGARMAGYIRPVGRAFALLRSFAVISPDTNCRIGVTEHKPTAMA